MKHYDRGCVGCGLTSLQEPTVEYRSDDHIRCADCYREALYGPWRSDDWYAMELERMKERAPA